MEWESRCACCPLVSFVLFSTVSIFSVLIIDKGVVGILHRC